MSKQYFPSAVARANWLYEQRFPCEGCGMYLWGDPDLEVGEETMLFTHPDCRSRYENKNKNQQHLAPVLYLVSSQEMNPAMETEKWQVA